MSNSALAGKISNIIISNMYKNKGRMNENGEKVYRKNGFTLGAGIVLLLIFIPCIFCNNYFIEELILENSIEADMKTIYTFLGYAIEIFMNILALYLIITYKKFRLIISRERIICYGVFSKKAIELYSLEKITYSNFTGLVFGGNKTKIKFGIFTNGLIEVLNFIEENIPEYKYKESIKKARKMLKKNRIE